MPFLLSDPVNHLETHRIYLQRGHELRGETTYIVGFHPHVFIDFLFFLCIKTKVESIKTKYNNVMYMTSIHSTEETENGEKYQIYVKRHRDCNVLLIL